MSRPAPDHAIWELTWRCNLRCTHCLVEGGPNELEELTEEEALSLVDQLAKLGVRRVTLTGGEPFFRKDWHTISARIREHGLMLIYSCNGHLLNDRTIEKLIVLETSWIALSVDGLPATHDRQRRFPEAGARLSSASIVEDAIRRLVESPIQVGVITTVSADNLDELFELHSRLKALKVDQWMVQLAHPQGRFAEGEQAMRMLPRERMHELSAFLVEASRDPVLPPLVHNTIGWLSRDEAHLRSSGGPGSESGASPPSGTAVRVERRWSHSSQMVGSRAVPTRWGTHLWWALCERSHSRPSGRIAVAGTGLHPSRSRWWGRVHPVGGHSDAAAGVRAWPGTRRGGSMTTPGVFMP